MQNTPTSADSQDPASGSSWHRLRHRRIWLIGLILVLIILGIVIWRVIAGRRAAAAAAQRVTTISIKTATATKGDINIYLDAIGTVTPVYTDSLTTQVNGLVTQVHYTEGQRVRKGDPLIEIDPRSYQATLLQAQGILERDQGLLAQAKMDLTRYQAALARNAIARQIVDDQDKLVQQDEGTVKNDQGSVQYDQLQLEYCHISAPISGQVGLRLVDPGNVVQASGATTLAVITQLQPITVVFTLPEDSLAPVAARLAQKAKLAVDAFDRAAQKKIASGELLALDNQIDTTTGTLKARAIFPNQDYALFPNQFVNTRLLVNTEQGVTLVPSSTVQQNGQSAFVYVIQDNVAHLRTVKPGVTDAGNTAVDGISPGDVVADSSFDKLQDNTKVTIANAPAPGPAASGVKPPPAAMPPPKAAAGS
jgi:multidrug efflux system membrane fusion protein